MISIETAIVLATVAGPILAVQAQKLVERTTERRNAKKRIFYTLMATRAARVAADHVQALNMIDLEFGKGRWGWWLAKDKEVIKRWRSYADHLGVQFADDPTALRSWVDRGDELFLDLLEAMAKALSYDFDRVQLKRGLYYPRAHSEAEQRREVFERALVRIVTGEDALPVRFSSVNDDTEAEDPVVAELRRRLLLSFDDDGAIKIRQI